MASVPSWPNGDDTVILWEQENPKRLGSKAWERYEKYKPSKTVREAKKNGATAADFGNDFEKGFLKILEAIADDSNNEFANQNEKGSSSAAATSKTKKNLPHAAPPPPIKREPLQSSPAASSSKKRKASDDAKEMAHDNFREPVVTKQAKKEPVATDETSAIPSGKKRKCSNDSKDSVTIKEVKKEAAEKEEKAMEDWWMLPSTLANRACGIDEGPAATACLPRWWALPSTLANRACGLGEGPFLQARRRKVRDGKKFGACKTEKKDKKQKKEKKHKKRLRDDLEPNPGDTRLPECVQEGGASASRGADGGGRRQKSRRTNGSLVIEEPTITDSKGLYIRTRHSANAASQFLGVRPDRHKPELWKAVFREASGVAVNLGTFSTEEEAAQAFADAVRDPEARKSATKRKPAMAKVISASFAASKRIRGSIPVAKDKKLGNGTGVIKAAVATTSEKVSAAKITTTTNAVAKGLARHSLHHSKVQARRKAEKQDPVAIHGATEPAPKGKAGSVKTVAESLPVAKNGKASSPAAAKTAGGAHPTAAAQTSNKAGSAKPVAESPPAAKNGKAISPAAAKTAGSTHTTAKADNAKAVAESRPVAKKSQAIPPAAAKVAGGANPIAALQTGSKADGVQPVAESRPVAKNGKAIVPPPATAPGGAHQIAATPMGSKELNQPPSLSVLQRQINELDEDQIDSILELLAADTTANEGVYELDIANMPMPKLVQLNRIVMAAHAEKVKQRAAAKTPTPSPKTGGASTTSTQAVVPAAQHIAPQVAATKVAPPGMAPKDGHCPNLRQAPQQQPTQAGARQRPAPSAAKSVGAHVMPKGSEPGRPPVAVTTRPTTFTEPLLQQVPRTPPEVLQDNTGRQHTWHGIAQAASRSCDPRYSEPLPQNGGRSFLHETRFLGSHPVEPTATMDPLAGTPLEAEAWLGEDGMWAPGFEPPDSAVSSLNPPKIPLGNTNPPGPCDAHCGCSQSILLKVNEMERPWRTTDRIAKVQAALMEFQSHGVLRRGAVSRQNRFEPAAPGWHERSVRRQAVGQPSRSLHPPTAAISSTTVVVDSTPPL